MMHVWDETTQTVQINAEDSISEEAIAYTDYGGIELWKDDLPKKQ